MRISDWSSDVCSSDLFINGDRDLFQIAIFVISNVLAGRAGALQAGELGQVFFRFGRPGFLHGGDHVPCAIVSVRGINAGINLEACRSEEHTSELQSLMRISYAVFCLKTKTKKW